MSTAALPPQIRVSLGTAITLGLITGKLNAAPTTAYLMTYYEGKCSANCSFCPQGRESKGSTDRLSRVTWPVYPIQAVMSSLKESVTQKKLGRVCIQALNYPQVFEDLEALVKEIKSGSSVAVSVSCQPQTPEKIHRLKQKGVDRLGVALDAATEAVFNQVKGKDSGGCYRWENLFQLITEALSVFGAGNVSTHIIVGLGETEREAVEVIERCTYLGVLPALFAFTPVRGTALEAKVPPDLGSYRRVQLARYLIINGKAKPADLSFDESGRITDFGLPQQQLETVIESGAPFCTSGCPDCNRPYYNEKPSGPIYNFPKNPNKQEIEKIKKELS